MRVSVIIEGDNEKHCPQEERSGASIARCLGLEGLLAQTFPLSEAELILVGSGEQTRRWAAEARAAGFGAIREVVATGEDYFEMKMAGRSIARSPILAVVDSDVFPRSSWLSTLVSGIEGGSDIAAGLTRLHWHGIASADSYLMTCFGAISWGAILGRDGKALGFHANNVGLRASLLEGIAPAKGLLRACAAHRLIDQWREERKKISFFRMQCVEHAFTLSWWFDMHSRSGREAMLLRRMFPNWPHRWVAKLGPLEPLITCVWRILLDSRQWWRYSFACGLGHTERIAIWPLCLLVSASTRSVEAWGAYAGMLSGNWRREASAHLQEQR